MTKVLIIFSSSDIGGAERSLTRMAAASIGGQVDYSLATLGGQGEWVVWSQTLGIAPIIFGSRLRNGRRYRIGLKSLLSLIAFVRKQRFSVIYVIGLRPSIALRLLRFLLGGSRVVHGIRWNPSSNSKLDRLFRFVERISSGLIDHYICNSRAAADVLVNSLGISTRKVSVIYNGLADLPSLDTIKGPSSPVALTIANIAVRKGQREYLNIIASLPRERSEKFVFVGRDDLNGQFQQEVARLHLHDCVEYHGFVSDIESQLRRARVMVLPSLHNEGTPTSILESYALGVPVVAYAIDGLPEIVVDGVTGYLVAPGDQSTFRERVLELMSNGERARAMGLSGRALVEEKFKLGACVSEHAACFLDLVGQTQARL